MTARKRKAPAPLDARSFVEAWMSSSSLSEVSEKTGRSEEACSVYASQLRGVGVELPTMWQLRGKSEINVDDLNSMIKKAGRS